MTEINGVKLDYLALQTLGLILESPSHEINTTNAKHALGKSNDKIRYRFERLEEAGLVDLRDAEEYSSPIPPTVASIKDEDRAQDLVETLDLPDTIPAKLDRIFGILERQTERLDRLEKRVTVNEKDLPQYIDLVEMNQAVTSYLRSVGAELANHHPANNPRQD